jgi:hypothetical protein
MPDQPQRPKRPTQIEQVAGKLSDPTAPMLLPLSKAEAFRVAELMHDCQRDLQPCSDPFDADTFHARLPEIVGAEKARRFFGAFEIRLTYYSTGSITLEGRTWP